MLVLGPAIWLGLYLAGLLSIEGGHGLADWLCLSVGFVLALVGTLLSTFLARSGSRPQLAVAVLGVGTLVLFLVRFGMPFAR